MKGQTVRRGLVAAACVSALVIGGGAPATATEDRPPAATTHTQETPQDGVFALPLGPLEADTLNAQVALAQTSGKAASVLTLHGFSPVTDPDAPGQVRYEKTVDGITVGYTLPDKTMAPMWKVGWNRGPYIKATPSQWLALARGGTILGTAACAS